MANLLLYLVFAILFMGGCRQEAPLNSSASATDSLSNSFAIDTIRTSNPGASYKNSANFTTTGMASYYADRLHGKPTASGEPYDTAAFTAAHRTLPFGSLVKVTRISTGQSVEVRINDRGPHVKKRIIDLSKAAAKALGFYKKGVARVQLEVLREEENSN